jgi:hypothetical protein
MDNAYKFPLSIYIQPYTAITFSLPQFFIGEGVLYQLYFEKRHAKIILQSRKESRPVK